MNLSDKQNWYKYKRIFPSCNPRETGVFALSFHDKIIHGCISNPYGAELEVFSERDTPIEDINSAYEAFSQRYNARNLTVIRRDDLLKTVMDLMPPPGEPDKSPSYAKHLQDIRKSLSLDKQDKNAHYEFRGDIQNEHCLSKPHFFTNIFNSIIADLLPEQKLLYLGIIDEDKQSLESIILEFEGRELISFSDPDFAHFDWRSLTQTFPNPEAAAHFVMWAENRYQLPTYSIFVSARVWREATVYQQKSGYRAAWKYLMQARSTSDLNREFLIEPEPWPFRAVLYWHGSAAANLGF